MACTAAGAAQGRLLVGPVQGPTALAMAVVWPPRFCCGTAAAGRLCAVSILFQSH